MSSKKFISKKGFFSLGTNSRGFNMFSAIVAMILIMTSVVLTSTLVTTEEKTSRQIYSMLNNYQLADAANLARADAIQSFNYNFRDKLEEYLTYSDVELRDETGFPLFTIRNGSETFEWDQIKKTFEQTILLTGDADDYNAGKKFAAAISFVADRTIEQFNEGTYGKFSIYLSDKSANAKELLRASIVSSIQKEADKGLDFLEVVDCGESSCETGTFYFNIPLNNLSEEQYEALPRIIVKDLVTQEEIKMGILPRTELRVYIPLRFFKALYEARKSAIALKRVGVNLKDYHLGFCRADNKCQPRGNPWGTNISTWAAACPTTGSEMADLAPIGGVAPAGVTKYLIGGNNTGADGLVAYGSDAVCAQVKTDGGFDTDDTTFYVKDKELQVGRTARKLAIAGCGFDSLSIASGSEAQYRITGVGNLGLLRCAQVHAVYADIVYVETNQKYIVKGTYNEGKSDLYKIRLTNENFPRVQADKDLDLASLPECKSGASSCAP